MFTIETGGMVHNTSDNPNCCFHQFDCAPLTCMLSFNIIQHTSNAQQKSCEGEDMVYFDSAREDNTERTLQITKDEALKRGIRYVVVASTSGNTGLRAAQILQNTGIKLVVVAHSTGHRKAGQQLMDMEIKKQIENVGGIVFIGTDALTGFTHAMRERERFSEGTLISDTLRMFGQGMKVCVEIVAMASDANLLPVDDVISVAGTAKGADTSVIIGANSTNQFFSIKVREILAKPRDS